MNLEEQARECSEHLKSFRRIGLDLGPMEFLSVLSTFNESASVICFQKRKRGAQLFLDSFYAGETSLVAYGAIAELLQRNKTNAAMEYDRVGAEFVPREILSEFDAGNILDSGVIYHGKRSSDYARTESGILVRPQQLVGSQRVVKNPYNVFVAG